MCPTLRTKQPPLSVLVLGDDDPEVEAALNKVIQ